MNDLVEKRIKKYQDRHQVLKERGYDVGVARARVVENARPVTGRVLDVGTGPGRLAILLAEEKAKVTSIEYEAEGIATARKNAVDSSLENQIWFLRGDAGCMPFADETFDLVASANVIHHLAKPVDSIWEMLRVCKNDGCVVVADMNSTGLEMLGEVHAEFGGRHEVGPMNISEVFAALDVDGLFVERWEDELQVLFRVSFLV